MELRISYNSTRPPFPTLIKNNFDLSTITVCLTYANARIHERINAAARNPVLAQTYRTVNARLQALRFRSNFDERKWAVAVQEHENMLGLLAARDGPGLRALLVQHLEHKRDAVLDLMEQGALPGGSRVSA